MVNAKVYIESAISQLAAAKNEEECSQMAGVADILEALKGLEEADILTGMLRETLGRMPMLCVLDPLRAVSLLSSYITIGYIAGRAARDAEILEGKEIL